MKLENAKSISTMLLRMSDELSSALVVVKETESDAEFRTYKEATSKVLFEMLVGILNPIFAERPELAPEEMRSAFLPRPGEPI
jgi:hypothetical protein